MANTRVDFASAIDAWTIKTERRMEFVFRDATGRVFDEVYMRTPVDTGFLRNSFGASTQSMPMIEPKAKGGSALAVQPYDFIVQTAELGSTIYGGFVASYSAYVEYGTTRMAPRRMVALSAQNWRDHVSDAIKTAKSTIK